jgi:hypothetical protein
MEVGGQIHAQASLSSGTQPPGIHCIDLIDAIEERKTSCPHENRNQIPQMSCLQPINCTY